MAPSLWIPDIVHDAFLGEKVLIVVHKGWELRSAKTTTVDHQGIMPHDTGSTSTAEYDDVVNWMKTGSPIAPLANIGTCPAGYGVTTRNPRIDIMAAGRTNHGGRPDETWDPFDAWLVALANKHMLGVEHFWRAGMGWSQEYIDMIAHLDAAMLNHMEQPVTKIVAHKEYATGRKLDPRLLNMDEYRDRVTTAMEEDMPLSDKDIERIKDAIIGNKWRDYITGDPYTHAAASFAARASGWRIERDVAIIRRIVEEMAMKRFGKLTQEDIDALAEEVVAELGERLLQSPTEP